EVSVDILPPTIERVWGDGTKWKHVIEPEVIYRYVTGVNNFRGFSLNFAAVSYENFLSAAPQSSITLRAAPEVRFSSVDQSLSERIPAYFSFSAFSGAARRSETVTPFETPGYVERSEFAPSFTFPLHWGPWLNVTPSFTFRSTYYGGQLQNGAYAGQGFFRGGFRRHTSADNRARVGRRHEMEACDRTGSDLPVCDRREQFFEIPPVR
ncbi:MAG: LPS assembly protein LptD, partial [Candidatus Acidiferrales bacterium]